MLALPFLILVGGAILQATVGFGMGMFSVPLLVLGGFSLAGAIGLTMPVVVIQTAFNCWQNRRVLPWRDVLPMVAWRLVGLPAGLCGLMLLDRSGTVVVKRALGGTILLALLVQLAVRLRPRERVDRKWDAVAGTLSGVLAGMVGMGAPPMVLWLMAHDWDQTRSRSFMWLSIFLMLPVYVTLLAWVGGTRVQTDILHGLFLAPAGVVGGWIGGLIGRNLSKHRLRVAMIGVLSGIALYSIVQP